MTRYDMYTEFLCPKCKIGLLHFRGVRDSRSKRFTNKKRITVMSGQMSSAIVFMLEDCCPYCGAVEEIADQFVDKERIWNKMVIGDDLFSFVPFGKD